MSDVAPAPTTPDPWSMTPAEAGARLAEMTAAASPMPALVPVTPTDASAQLDLLAKDKSFADALFSGDVAANNRFKELVTLASSADDVADAIAGRSPPVHEIQVTADGQLSRSVIDGTVSMLREAGVSDGAIAEALRGDKVSRAEFEAVRQFQRQRHGDADWRGRLLSGDYAATREFHLMSIVLSAGIKEDAA